MPWSTCSADIPWSAANLSTPASGDASTFNFSYDAFDNPTSLNDELRQYVLDALGNVTSMSVAPSASAPNATNYTATYDTGNRLTSLVSYGASLMPLHNESYGYDGAGNRSNITLDGTTTQYTYDADHQLLSSTVGSQTPTTYSYDANHNRTKLVSAARTTTYCYDASNTRLTQLSDPSGKVTTYAYDGGMAGDVGNLTSKVYDPSGANQIT